MEPSNAKPRAVYTTDVSDAEREFCQPYLVERSFGWAARFKRLSLDYDRRERFVFAERAGPVTRFGLYSHKRNRRRSLGPGSVFEFAD